MISNGFVNLYVAIIRQGLADLVKCKRALRRLEENTNKPKRGTYVIGIYCKSAEDIRNLYNKTVNELRAIPPITLGGCDIDVIIRDYEREHLDDDD